MTYSDWLSLLIQLAVMLSTALLCGRIMRLFHQPAVLGELIGGVLLGPTLLNLFPHAGAAFESREAIARLGLLFFLFAAGLEVQLDHLKKYRNQIFIISFTGITIPFLAGFILGWFILKHSLLLALFLGVALSISALPVIARILTDCNLMKTPLGTVILATATIDDLIGWTLFLILLTNFMPDAQPSQWLGKYFIFAAFLVGAFLSMQKKSPQKKRETFYRVASQWIAPIYFVSVGLKTNFAQHFDAGLTLLILSVACFGKVVGAGWGAHISGFKWREALSIGFGMNARGAMEIVLASIALEYGMIDARLFVALVLTALITSLISGPAMKALLR